MLGLQHGEVAVCTGRAKAERKGQGEKFFRAADPTCLLGIGMCFFSHQFSCVLVLLLYR